MTNQQNDPQMSFYESAKFENDGQVLWLTYHMVEIASKVNQLKERIAKLSNELGISKHGVIQRAFIAGVAALELELEQQTDPFLTDTAYISRLKMLVAIKARRQKWEEWQEILQDFGEDRDKFIEWCETANQEGYAEFLDYTENHTLSFAKKANNEQEYTQFLRTFMESGKEYSAMSDIKPAMENANIIATMEEWQAVKVAASRAGLSGGSRTKGYWSL